MQCENLALHTLLLPASVEPSHSLMVPVLAKYMLLLLVSLEPFLHVYDTSCLLCVCKEHQYWTLCHAKTFPITTVTITTMILTDTITTSTTLTILSPPPSSSRPLPPPSLLSSLLQPSSYKTQNTDTILSSVEDTVKWHPSTNCKWHQHILPWTLGTCLSHFISSTFGGRLTVFSPFALNKTFCTIYKQPCYWVLWVFLQFCGGRESLLPWNIFRYRFYEDIVYLC